MIVSVSGHRPQKLGGFRLPNPTYIYVCQKLEETLLELKPDKVISGMALGVDQWFANISRKLNIPFIAAIPFEGQELAWPASSQKAFHLLLKSASEKVIVSPGGYSAYKMQVRNEWMVDRCDKLIAVWDHGHGGTGNCVRYAQSKNKEIIFIDPRISE